MKTDFTYVKVDVEDRIAILCMDNPPVNQLSERFVQELIKAISGGFQDPDIKALVLTGTAKNFVAGADLTEVAPVRDKAVLLPRVEAMSAFLNHIETGPKPVIAAINGNALGGGIAIGHALGATGIRMVGTLARILEHKGARYGCANACVGGGQGVATVIERVS